VVNSYLGSPALSAASTHASHLSASCNTCSDSPSGRLAANALAAIKTDNLVLRHT